MISLVSIICELRILIIICSGLFKIRNDYVLFKYKNGDDDESNDTQNIWRGFTV